MTDERGGRYFREARFFLAGDKVAAQSHILEARSLMGYMRDQHSLGGPAIQVQYATLKDGTQIKATMMNGQYQAEIVAYNPRVQREIEYTAGFYVVSAVDGLLRVFTADASDASDAIGSPIGVYGDPGTLPCITMNIPTYRKLDTTENVRFCKMQFGTPNGPLAVKRPDGRTDLGASGSAFARYCSARYTYVSYYSYSTELYRGKGRKLMRSAGIPYPVVSVTGDHSPAEAEITPYMKWTTVTDPTLFMATDSWLSTAVGDVYVVYNPGKYATEVHPTQTEIDQFCFRVFAGPQREDKVYNTYLKRFAPGLEFWTSDNPQDLPLVALSPWYTALRGQTGGFAPIWGGPVDHVFKPNASGTRASIVLYTPAHYKVITGLTPPVATTQLVHMDVAGTYEAPVFSFTTENVDADIIAIDYRGDTLVAVGYAAFTRTAGLPTGRNGLWSSDGWLDEPLAIAIYDLDIRAQACLFSTSEGGFKTYFVLGTKKTEVIHPALTGGPSRGTAGQAIDALPFFYTYYSPGPATYVAGEQSGPAFLLLPNNRALIFIRPMFYYLLGYNEGDAGHCQILLYTHGDDDTASGTLQDVTSILVPAVDALPYGDHLYPPWLDFGFIDELSADLQALPVPPT